MCMEPERPYDHEQTRDQLLREAIEIIDAWSSGRETDLDGREWLKTARREIDPLPVVQLQKETWDPWERRSK